MLLKNALPHLVCIRRRSTLFRINFRDLVEREMHNSSRLYFLRKKNGFISPAAYILHTYRDITGIYLRLYSLLNVTKKNIYINTLLSVPSSMSSVHVVAFISFFSRSLKVVIVRVNNFVPCPLSKSIRV